MPRATFAHRPDHHGDLHFGQTDRPPPALRDCGRWALVRVFAVLALFAALALPAAAASLQEALARFAANDFAETAKAIDEIAESGAPQAVSLMRCAAQPAAGGDAGRRRVLHRRQQSRLRRPDRQPGRRRAQGRPIGAHQQQAARRRSRIRSARCGCRRPIRPSGARPPRSVLRARDVSALPAVRTALSREQDPRHRQGVCARPRRRWCCRARMPPPSRRRSPSPSCAPAPTRTPSPRCAPPPPARPSPSPRRRAAPSWRSRSGWKSRRPCRTSGTACRSARCCCWRRSALPSPSA